MLSDLVIKHLSGKNCGSLFPELMSEQTGIQIGRKFEKVQTKKRHRPELTGIDQRVPDWNKECDQEGRTHGYIKLDL